MAWEAVDVFVASSLTSDPIEGVLVRFYNSAGTTIYTEGQSDADGKVSVLLPVALFTVRLYRFGYSFGPPQLLDVQASPAVNAFTVRGTELQPRPLSTDPRLCRCSGYFRDLNGAPRPYLDMHFRPQFAAVVLEGAGVISETVIVRTDENGWAELDLIRGAKYVVTVEALGCEREVLVPDAASTNLPDALLAVVDSVSFDVDPVSVSVGSSVEVTPTVLTSSRVVLTGTANEDVTWKMADTSIATVQVKANVLVITGRVAGTTTLTAERQDNSIVRIPNTPISGQPLQVTVV